MPAMTIPELKKFIAEHFLQAPADVEIEHLDDTKIRVRQKKIRVRQKTHDRNLRPGGTVAGPTVMAMVDFGFYLLLLGRLGPVAHAVTTNLNINFMRKPEPVDLLGEGRLLKLGKTLAVGDFTVWSDGKKEPVAHATVTYSIPPKKA
jgi:acyl-coenzyme A thioesterase PaaI-like protein